MVAIPLNAQAQPVEYMLRKFVINYNIQGLAKIAGPNHLGSGKFPTLTVDSALAYAAFCLAKLRVAQLVIASGATGWDQYLTDAETQADAALSSVSASQWGFFPSPARMVAQLQAFATRTGAAHIAAPGALPVDWFTRPDAAPVAPDINTTVAHGAAISINVFTGATDPDIGDILTVKSINGTYATDGEVYNVEMPDGEPLALTYVAATHLLTGVAPNGAGVLHIPVVITDGHIDVTRMVNLTITGETLTVAPVAGALPAATHGVPYAEAIVAAGGTAPYAYTIDPDGQPLPAGLHLDATGHLAGTIDQEGDVAFDVVITDAVNVSETVHYTLRIN